LTGVIIEQAGSSRPVAPGDFPLKLGGPASDIPLPGTSDGDPVAWIGTSQGELFVQAGPRSERIVCNGVPVAASQWIREGDVLEVGTLQITLTPGTSGIRLCVDRIQSTNTTVPPVTVSQPIQEMGTTDSTIRPVSFSPRPVSEPRRARRRIRPAIVASAAGLVALLTIVWFVVSSRSVEIRVEPEPDTLELRGSLPALKLAGRYLMRPGTYTLIAEKAGYRRLEVPVEVDRDSESSLAFTLEELGGLLNVDTDPVEGAEVRIDGETVGITPLEGIELTTGAHEVRIVADRHLEYATEIQVEGKGTVQTLRADLEPDWAAVSFDSEPRGATLQLAGTNRGTTPVTLELPGGSYRLEFRLRGYRAHRGSVTVVAGEPQNLPPVRLTLADGAVALRTEPTGATVSVDGEYRGQTPLDVVLGPGQDYLLQVSKAGHHSESRDVRVRAGESRSMVITLRVIEGDVEVRANVGDAELWVDGEALGVANQTVRLSAVPHEIEVRRDGYETYRTTVTPRPGLVESIAVVLQPLEQDLAAVAPQATESPQGHPLVLIDGGRFQMGASRREPGRRSNEGLRQVELTRPFYLATRETTNREFRAFKAEHLSGQIGGYNLEIDHHPVVRVTWEEAALYCNWLSRQESLPPAYIRIGERVVAAEPLTTGYRLPLEAEWAWAARYHEGPEPLKYPWGDTLPIAPGSGNYADASAAGLLSQVLKGYNDSYAVTAPAESFSPNALGLLNLGGNVTEWMHDIYIIYPSGSEQRDPTGPKEGELHVIRGSSWMDATVSELRLSYRDYGKKPRPDLGFRIARYVGPPPRTAQEKKP
jgi:formylglycine-generating enzyme required for sulfatase activity